MSRSIVGPGLLVSVVLVGCSSGRPSGPTIECDKPTLHDCYPELDRQIDGEPSDVQVVSDEVDMCSAGDRVYVVWIDDRDGYKDVWFNTSRDRGLTWLPTPKEIKLGAGHASNVDLACIGDSLVVAWEDTRDSQSDYTNIYLNYSLDGGDTWQDQEIVLDDDPEGRAISLAPRIAMRRDRQAGRDDVHVTWFDQVNARAPEVYVASGTMDRAGLRFGKPVRLSGDLLELGVGWSGNPRPAVDGAGRLHVVWEDTRNALDGKGSQDVFHTVSNQGGSWPSFEEIPQNRMTVGSPPGESFGFSPDICADGDHVHIVWHDTRNGIGTNGRDIYLQYSSDGGLSWFRQARRVETDAPGSAESFNARVACEGPVAHVVWQDNRDGAYDIYYRRVEAGRVSVDDGAEAEVRLDAGDPPGANISENPVVVRRGDVLMVGWTDRRAVGAEALTDLYYNYMTFDAEGNVAQKWLDKSDLRLDSLTPGTKYAERLRLDVHEDVVYAAWVDNRDGRIDGTTYADKDIFFSRSFLGEGATQYLDLIKKGTSGR